MALVLLQFGHWQSWQVERLLQSCTKPSLGWTEVLRSWAFDQTPTLDFSARQRLLTALVAAKDCLLGTLILPEYAAVLFLRCFQAGVLDVEESRLLATVLAWNMALAEHLPDELPSMAPCNDASLSIIALAKDHLVHLKELPEPWQWKALAAWIYRRDNPNFHMRIDLPFADKEDAFVLFVYATQPQHLRQMIVQALPLLFSAEVWLIRAFRRRWLFASPDPVVLDAQKKVVLHEEKDWEMALLLLSLGELSVLPRIVDWLLSSTDLAAHSWQDLAESILLPQQLAARFSVENIEQLMKLQQCFLWPNTNSTLLLSLGILLQHFAIPIPWPQISAQLADCVLPPWQQQQKQELYQLIH